MSAVAARKKANTQGNPARPKASSVVRTGWIVNASSVPVSCSSRRRWAIPLLAEAMIRVMMIPTVAKAKYDGAPLNFELDMPANVFEMK